DYKEAGPQLLLQSFLQRIVNGGGEIRREYGLGRKRTDLLITWPYPGGVQRIVLELKLARTAPDKVIAEGLVQTADYADRCNADEAHLLIFDRRPRRRWSDRIYRRARKHQGRPITVWGL
ncbi:MAG: ATP-binding protein, partial [Blastocatellia bacterium]